MNTFNSYNTIFLFDCNGRIVFHRSNTIRIISTSLSTTVHVSLSIDTCNGLNWFINPQQVSASYSSIDDNVNADAGADARCGQGLIETNFIISDFSKWISVTLYYILLDTRTCWCCRPCEKYHCCISSQVQRYAS